MNIIKWPKPVRVKKKILKVAKGTVHTEAKKMRMITDFLETMKARQKSKVLKEQNCQPNMYAHQKYLSNTKTKIKTLRKKLKSKSTQRNEEHWKW